MSETTWAHNRCIAASRSFRGGYPLDDRRVCSAKVGDFRSLSELPESAGLARLGWADAPQAHRLGTAELGGSLGWRPGPLGLGPVHADQWNRDAAWRAGTRLRLAAGARRPAPEDADGPFSLAAFERRPSLVLPGVGSMNQQRESRGLSRKSG